MTTKTIFLSLLLASVAGISCKKEKSSPDQNAVLDAQLADITGIYHGTIRRWIVDGYDIPGDTVWTVGEGYFVLRTGRGENDSWSFLVSLDSLSTEGGLRHNLSGSSGGNIVFFSLQINVDPVYGFNDGQRGALTVWRSPRQAQGHFYRDASPGRYGFYYEGNKRD
jgi:hypothetical protein